MRKMYKNAKSLVFQLAFMWMLSIVVVSARAQSVSFDRNVTTFAGSTAGFTNATGTSAQFNKPFSAALDVSGNLYVADPNNHRIRKITPAGEVSTFAGSGTANLTDGTGTAAEFNFPYGVAVDTVSGNVYVADRGNNSIRMITSAGVVTTLAGSATAGSVDGTGAAAGFNFPYSVAVDGSGNVYVADYNNHLIRKITSAGVVTTLAGSTTSGFVDGTGTAARFKNPAGVAVDAFDNVYVADRLNHSIRKITPLGEVTTIAGNGTSGFADGTGTAARFYSPHGVSLDTSGNVYVADYTNNRIRHISPAGVVSTIGGEVQNYVDGIGGEARFYYPTGLAADVSGNVYVADYYNDRIRKITPLVLTAFSNTEGTASAAQIFYVKGTILTSDLVVTAPAGYEISLSSGSGYGSTVSLSPVTGTVSTTPIYIRLSAAAAVGTNSGNIQLSSTGTVTQTMAVTGVTAARIDQTITFDPFTTPQTFGNPTFDLTATSTSGLTVSFTSSNTSVATVSGNTVTIVSAGSADITAVQAGNTTYNPAPDVVQTLVVDKANQTIPFTGFAPATYGDPAITLTANASSGLPITYTSYNTAVATVSGNVVTIVGVGMADIGATQAGNANYNAATDVMHTLTVAKADQTITFAALSAKTMVDPDFNLTATASSGLALTYTSSNTSVATISGNTVTIVGEGSTNITASQAGNTNYNAATDVVQALVVTKADQTITFAALPAKTMADPDFTLTATASSGLPITYTSSNTSVATVSGNTVTIVGAGVTDITATQAGDADYNAAPLVYQTLTITKVNQTITFNSLPSKTEGDAPFDVNVSASSGLTVTLTSSNHAVATVSGNTITIVGAGTATITASQAGDATYAAAPDVERALVVTSTTGLRPLTILESKSYPNPATDVLYIEPKQRLYGNLTLTLSDMQGKIAYSTVAQGGEESYTVDISSLESGVYMLELSNGTEVISQRIVKK